MSGEIERARSTWSAKRDASLRRRPIPSRRAAGIVGYAAGRPRERSRRPRESTEGQDPGHEPAAAATEAGEGGRVGRRDPALQKVVASDPQIFHGAARAGLALARKREWARALRTRARGRADADYDRRPLHARAGVRVARRRPEAIAELRAALAKEPATRRPRRSSRSCRRRARRRHRRATEPLPETERRMLVPRPSCRSREVP
jgi:hypothetical protein